MRKALRAEWRREHFERQQGRCVYCRRQMVPIPTEPWEKQSECTLDHLVPVSRGGDDSWENTVAACWQCNRSKGDRASGAMLCSLNGCGPPHRRVPAAALTPPRKRHPC